MKKYQKIYSDLLGKINKNELKEYEKIPTESELCKLYGVSRITAVRAVNELAKDKLIVRHPKTGSFVSSHHFNPLLPFYILIPSFVHNFFTKSSYAFSEYFRNKGCIAGIIYTRFNLNYISMVIDSLNNTGCSGIAIYPSAHKNDELPLLKLLEVARFNVAIGYRELEGFSGAEVIIDEYDASAQAVNHLVDLGHRRIAYIGPELEADETSNHIRYNAFRKTCAEKGLKEDDCPFIEKTDHLSTHTIKKIFQSKFYPTAVVTVSEYYAVIIFDMLTSFGIEIPKNVAIISIDGGELSSSVEVPFTAVEFPAYKIGERLAEELYNMAKNPNLGKIKKVFKEKSTIIVRDSCGSNTKHRHEYIREKVRVVG